MRLFIFSALFLLLPSPTYSANKVIQKNYVSQVYSKEGNIYYSKNRGQDVQITYSEKDFSPILSPNKKMIAFIRTGNTVIPKECDVDAQYGNQIWIYTIETKKEHLLVKGHLKCDKPEQQIIDPSHLLFSPDSKIVYFMTSAWVTSSALHAVKIDSAKQNYIVPANSFEIISKGQYKGHLIVYQHRYFVGGGTYDWYWLISPNGKEEGPLGEEITEAQRKYIESEA